MEGTDKPRWWSMHTQSPQLRLLVLECIFNILEKVYVYLVKFSVRFRAYPSTSADIVRTTPSTLEAGVTICLYPFHLLIIPTSGHPLVQYVESLQICAVFSSSIFFILKEC